ncbi:maleylacetate reductase [Rhizobiales bacterium GAS191]|nr:maleylacetate reductase [Rhizobiales bacterium GAS191]
MQADNMSLPFTYTVSPARVVFGHGTSERIAAEVERLGCSRVLVLSTPQQIAWAEALRTRLQGLCVGVYAGAAMHTPLATTNHALELVAANGADCTLALGGGSAIGLGKAIAWRTDLPQIVMPTTYAGSEATPILGETIDGRKTTVRDAKVLPEVIVYDVEPTLTLPAALSAMSGLNAIAHAMEALYANDANPIVSAIAEYGVSALSNALPRIAENGRDREARAQALMGAWACGTCLGAVGMALHHKLCHVLGGAFDLPHAETHAVLLPHTAAYNAAAAPDAMARIARALGGPDAPFSLFDLAARLNAPTSLKQIGMLERNLDRAAELALENPYWNPAPIERDGVRSLLDHAFHGRRPMATPARTRRP